MLLRAKESCWEVCIADFGVAKVESLADTVTQTGFKGTPASMSPEQLKESECVTTKADCYGYGVLMWELATGFHPWQGLGLLHVMTKVVVENMRPPTQPVKQAGFPERFIEVMSSCWDSDPAQRPSMDEVRGALHDMYSAEVQREHFSA